LPVISFVATKAVPASPFLFETVSSTKKALGSTQRSTNCALPLIAIVSDPLASEHRFARPVPLTWRYESCARSTDVIAFAGLTTDPAIIAAAMAAAAAELPLSADSSTRVSGALVIGMNAEAAPRASASTIA